MIKLTYSLLHQQFIVMNGYYVSATWTNSLNGNYWDCTGIVQAIRHCHENWFEVDIKVIMGADIQYCTVVMFID